MVEGIRPELHRYCARLTGSVIEGEDIVQDTLAKALYALSLMPEAPPLRPWLFRIAHNTAIDFLKSHGRKYTETKDDLDETVSFDEKPDPEIVRAALVRFLALPITQRSAVILKDVLDHSLEETAETMGTTVSAVKAALVRGRRALLAGGKDEETFSPEKIAELRKYAELFNARDWDGVRTLIAEDCELDLVSKSQRRGKAVGLYFSNYEKLDVALELVRLEGRPAFAVFVSGAKTPSYFILVEIENGKVTSIRDFKYVPYIAKEASIEEIV